MERSCEDCNVSTVICYCKSCGKLLCENCKEQHFALGHDLSSFHAQEVGGTGNFILHTIILRYQECKGGGCAGDKYIPPA